MEWDHRAHEGQGMPATSRRSWPRVLTDASFACVRLRSRTKVGVRLLWVDCVPPASDRLARNLPFEVARESADGRAYPKPARSRRSPAAALGSVPFVALRTTSAHSPSPEGGINPISGALCWLNERARPRRRCGCGRRKPPRRAPKRRAASCPRCRRRAWRLGP
jgi:hypothetical protein